LASDKPASQAVLEVRDRGKGAVCEAAKFVFSPSDHTKGNVLENAVVDEKVKNPFSIVG
jgi:hypothetical protein